MEDELADISVRMNIMVAGPHCLQLIIGRDGADRSAEYFWILAAPGSTLGPCNGVGHLVASFHLVAVWYLVLGIGNPGEELARVVWVPDGAGCLALCLI